MLGSFMLKIHSAVLTVPALGGNKSMNPNAGAAGMEKDMDDMRNRVASQEAEARIHARGRVDNEIL